MSVLDTRPRTYFIDLDGTLFYHNGSQFENSSSSSLPGAKEFIDSLMAQGHRVILTTGRREVLRRRTEQQLDLYHIVYDQLIMDLPPGVRIVINDEKHDLSRTAYGLTVPRNKGRVDLMRWEEHTLSAEAHADVLRDESS